MQFNSDYYDEIDSNIEELKLYEKQMLKQEDNEEEDKTQANTIDQQNAQKVDLDKENILNPKQNIPIAAKKNLKDV